MTWPERGHHSIATQHCGVAGGDQQPHHRHICRRDQVDEDPGGFERVGCPRSGRTARQREKHMAAIGWLDEGEIA